MQLQASPGDSSFTIFGSDHLLAIVTLTVAGVWLIVTGRRHGVDSAFVRRARWTMAALQIANLTGWHVRALVRGEWNVQESLPLHLCDVAVFVSVAALLRPRPLSFELTYLWCLGGTLQGLITPNIIEAFPHYRFWHYFILHGGLVISALFLVACCELRPRRRTLLRVWIASNVLAAVAATANVLLDSNYMFLCEAPATGSLLDYLGPWPWYIASEQVVALAIFALLLLPFRRRTD